MQRMERVIRLVAATRSTEAIAFCDALEGTLNVLSSAKKSPDEKAMSIMRHLRKLSDADASDLLQVLEDQVFDGPN